MQNYRSRLVKALQPLPSARSSRMQKEGIDNGCFYAMVFHFGGDKDGQRRELNVRAVQGRAGSRDCGCGRRLTSNKVQLRFYRRRSGATKRRLMNELSQGVNERESNKQSCLLNRPRQRQHSLPKIRCHKSFAVVWMRGLQKNTKSRSLHHNRTRHSETNGMMNMEMLSWCVRKSKSE